MRTQKMRTAKKMQKFQNKMFRLLGRKTVNDKVSSESLAIKFGFMSVNHIPLPYGNLQHHQPWFIRETTSKIDAKKCQ